MTRLKVQIVLVAVVLIGVAGVAAGQTEELVRVIAMEPGGRFTLGNVSGDITVTGVDGDHLTIRATKRVDGRGSAAADGLDRVEIDIEAVARQGVESPRVEVETVSGSVTFDGALAADGRYGFQSHSGSIFLTVPDGSGFELDAQSFNGDLRSDIPILVGRGDPSRQTPIFGGGSRAIRGIAAAGGARFELSTVSGDMAIGLRASPLLQPAASRPAGSIDIR